MKSHKIALTLVLTTLIIIYGVLVEAEPIVIFPTTKTSPPPISPPPIIPPTTSTSTTTSLTTNSTSAPIPTTPLLPPPSSPPVSPTPSPIPSTPPLAPPLTPSSTPPLTPSSSSPNPASPSDAAQSCSESNNICSDPKTFCHLSLGICQPKGDLGDSCRKDNECLEPFVCNKNTCQYSDSGTANNQDDNHYNVKKVAIIGAIVVGVSGVCGLTFFMYRQFKKKNDYDITSRLYSTDDEMSEPDPYPFNERSNSFSNNNAAQPPPSRVPPKTHYDNLPPARNRAFAPPHQGYNNYYNNNNDGRYMRQNEPVTRTMNLLQQTRGNVVITPPQNYNWNPAVQQPQGGLFPIPSVKGNYGVPPVPPVPVPPVPFIPPPNNTNFNKNNNNNSAESSNRSQNKASSSYSVDYSSNYNNDQTKAALKELKDSNTSSPNNVKFDQQKETQPLNDPRALSDSSNLKQKDNVPVYRDSIFDYYTRDSIFAKTLENKLPMFKRNKNNDESAPEKRSTSTARIQTFGYDPKLLKSSTVEEKKIV